MTECAGQQPDSGQTRSPSQDLSPATHQQCSSARTPCRGVHRTELDFLRAIGRSDIQITYNIWAEREGYVGESTGIETANALLLGKPTILVRPMQEFSPDLPLVQPGRELPAVVLRRQRRAVAGKRPVFELPMVPMSRTAGSVRRPSWIRLGHFSSH